MILILGEELGELLEAFKIVVCHVNVQIGRVQHDILRAEVRMGGRRVYLMELIHASRNIPIKK